jgi:hypothetical protein
LAIRRLDACGDNRRFGYDTFGGLRGARVGGESVDCACRAEQRISFQYFALKTPTMSSMMPETLAGSCAHRMRFSERAGGLPEAEIVQRCKCHGPSAPASSRSPTKK